MGINWDVNLLAPLQAVFGEPVNYRPKAGTAYDIPGIFDRAYTEAVESIDDGPTINSTHPVLGVRDAVFSSPPQTGDRVYVYRVQTLFVINNVQPDSHGGSILILNRVGT
ncbi:head-tail joining protein [Martelella alba]|uniref:Head-tail joining protein n=1 Tax=Martelella alba TaxID=2590451 RepID=A0ABY2SDZ8_9HYPH|nr:hypothetical protein [Martelella alba]TKI02892.1 hypothetical protein FCN80_23565 [Martelella alba]